MEHGSGTLDLAGGQVIARSASNFSPTASSFSSWAGGFGQGYQRRLYDLSALLPSPAALRCSRLEHRCWASMAIRKSLFERVGFSTSASEPVPRLQRRFRILVPGAGRWRYLQRYDPRVVVHHYHRREIAGLKRQMYPYLRGHVAA